MVHISKGVRNASKQKKSLMLKSILRQNTAEFCANTSLHCIKYLAVKNLSTSEKCYFGISIIVVILMACLLIFRIYDKWMSTPLIVGINHLPTYITSLPFPAVTICNLNQALKSKTYSIIRDIQKNAMLQLLCGKEINITQLNKIKEWDHLENFIIDIAQPCEDLIVACAYGGKMYNCMHIFSPIVTDQGYCCTFNILHPDYMYKSYKPLTFQNRSRVSYNQQVNWHAELGYPPNLPKNASPRPAAGVGESLGLSLLLDAQKHQYYCSSSYSIGFKIVLHNPNEKPDMRELGVYVEPGKETKLRVRPHKTASEFELRTINKEVRHCLFYNEKTLRFFGHYTQRNCAFECIADLFQKTCGCVSYYLPRLYENTTICNIYNLQCEQRMRFDMQDDIRLCLDECLPSCFNLNYEMDSFSTVLRYEEFGTSKWNIKKSTHEYMQDNLALIHIYFKDNILHAYIKRLFIEFPDFLSSVGGLMGLFLGFSFLSLAELIYYAIIHPFYAMYNLNRVRPNSQQYIPRIHSTRRYGNFTHTLRNHYNNRFPNKDHRVFTYKKPALRAIPNISQQMERAPRAGYNYYD